MWSHISKIQSFDATSTHENKIGLRHHIPRTQYSDGRNQRWSYTARSHLVHKDIKELTSLTCILSIGIIVFILIVKAMTCDQRKVD